MDVGQKEAMGQHRCPGATCMAKTIEKLCIATEERCQFTASNPKLHIAPGERYVIMLIYDKNKVCINRTVSNSVSQNNADIF